MLVHVHNIVGLWLRPAVFVDRLLALFSFFAFRTLAPATLFRADIIALRFVPLGSIAHSDDEIELDDAACDEIEYEGTAFDLGEAVAQTLALAIDPFAEGPNAEAARKAAGLSDESSSGPFAALAALRKDG